MVLMVALLCEYTRNQRIAYFKWVNVCYVNYTSRMLLLKNNLQEKLGEARQPLKGIKKWRDIINTPRDGCYWFLQSTAVFLLSPENVAKNKVSCKSNCDKPPRESLPALLTKMVKGLLSFKGFSLLKGLHQSFLIFKSLNLPRFHLRPRW